MSDEKPQVATSDELDFLNMVLMLGHSASVELGMKPLPNGELQQNLPKARALVNMLGTLEKRTQGRRTPQEELVLNELLSQLRADYVKAAGLDQESPAMGVLAQIAARAYGQAPRRPDAR